MSRRKHLLSNFSKYGVAAVTLVGTATALQTHAVVTHHYQYLNQGVVAKKHDLKKGRSTDAVQTSVQLSAFSGEKVVRNDILYELSYDTAHKQYFYKATKCLNQLLRIVYVETKINDIYVTEIGDQCFADHGNIQTIVLPCFLKKIGNKAFGGCYNINKIIFLANKDNFEKISLPSGIFSSFRKYGQVQTVFASDQELLNRIGLPTWEIRNDFAVKNNIVYYLISNSERRPYYCVVKCLDSNIGDLNIEYAIKNIPVEEIRSNVFAECDNLTFIKIPCTVRKIHSNAFDWCKILKNNNYLTTFGNFIYITNHPHSVLNLQKPDDSIEWVNFDNWWGHVWMEDGFSISSSLYLETFKMFKTNPKQDTFFAYTPLE